MTLRPEDVRKAITSGKNQKLKDGHSLYPYVKNGHGFWIWQWTDFGPTKNNETPHAHTRSECLGPAHSMTPAQARKERESRVVARREGRDTRTSRRAAGELFSTAAASYLDNHADEWSARQRADLQSLAARYISAEFNALPVTTIMADDVADVLRPIWNGPGNNKGTRLRRIIEGVLRSKDIEPNPAAWARQQDRLSKKRVKPINQPSMPFADVPAFMATLGDSVEDRAGRFVILTAARRIEALGAKWSEFDFANRVWNIPAERMKAKRPHAVPLTAAMLAALGTPGDGDAYVFPSSRTGGILGHKSLDKEWVPNGYTLHGFRSSFQTWAAEQDDGRAYPFEVREAALAHGKANAVVEAYDRSKLFEARRKLMQSWSDFVTGTK
jgi:integrase